MPGERGFTIPRLPRFFPWVALVSVLTWVGQGLYADVRAQRERDEVKDHRDAAQDVRIAELGGKIDLILSTMTRIEGALERARSR